MNYSNELHYSKEKSKKRKNKIFLLEKQLQEIEEQMATNASPLIISQYDLIKNDLQIEYDYDTEGAIVRSRWNWYEFGEKNYKYFFNLEKANATKSQINFLMKSDGTTASSIKDINTEIKTFYEDLYSSSLENEVVNDPLSGL